MKEIKLKVSACLLSLKILPASYTLKCQFWHWKCLQEAVCHSVKSYRKPLVSSLAYFLCGQLEVGTREHRPITEKGILKRLFVCIFKISISPDMLFHGLFITSNLKIYLETLTGTVFGMVKHIWPSSGIWAWELPPPPLPLSTAPPPPLVCLPAGRRSNDTWDQYSFRVSYQHQSFLLVAGISIPLFRISSQNKQHLQFKTPSFLCSLRYRRCSAKIGGR